MNYRLTEAAESDLFELWAFIAMRNESAADRMEADILDACKRIATRPDLGHFRRDLTKREVRFFSVRGFCLIIYNPASMPIEVIRILHGARDASEELRKTLPNG